MIDTMAVGRPAAVAAYLIRGKESALIDIGYASSAETVRKTIDASGVGSIDYLLPTHVHLDHCGACGTLAKMYEAASVRVHPKGERHLIDPGKLWEGARELFGDELMNQYGRPQPIEAKRVRVIGDGEALNLGNGVTLRSIWTPGHASHHLSYVVEETGTLFTGDAVGISSEAYPVLIPTTPPTSFNLEAAVESLERIRQLSPKTFLTPHYGVVSDVEDSIDANILSLRDWTAGVSEMLERGLSIDSITSSLTEQIGSRLPKPTELPDYLRMSIRLSVLGAVRYLKSLDHA
jgi:glyoxylase-like metal-dependent hydrolase (beta-lactamase superfamily II)